MQLITPQSIDIFQALAEESRLRVMRLMCETGDEVCLCELVDSLREPAYKLSRHLKILRQAGLLSSRKEGRWVYHRLVREPRYLLRLYGAIMALPDEAGVFEADLRRFLERRGMRVDGRCIIGIQTEAFKDTAE